MKLEKSEECLQFAHRECRLGSALIINVRHDATLMRTIGVASRTVA